MLLDLLMEADWMELDREGKLAEWASPKRIQPCRYSHRSTPGTEHPNELSSLEEGLGNLSLEEDRMVEA
jgi:hypothetical protein